LLLSRPAPAGGVLLPACMMAWIAACSGLLTPSLYVRPSLLQWRGWSSRR
jgi:hypothetical protein